MYSHAIPFCLVSLSLLFTRLDPLSLPLLSPLERSVRPSVILAIPWPAICAAHSFSPPPTPHPTLLSVGLDIYFAVSFCLGLFVRDPLTNLSMRCCSLSPLVCPLSLSHAPLVALFTLAWILPLSVPFFFFFSRLFEFRLPPLRWIYYPSFHFLPSPCRSWLASMSSQQSQPPPCRPRSTDQERDRDQLSFGHPQLLINTQQRLFNFCFDRSRIRI